MPPGWFVPVKGSPAKERKQEVVEAAEKHDGKLHSFWQAHGDDDYSTLIEGVPDNKIQALLADPKLKAKSGHHKVEIH
jgi:hypothetical protein